MTNMSLRTFALAAVLSLVAADSGTGTTTRYWDCCKPSCAWNDLDTLGIHSSVTACDANDQPLSSNTDQSGCTGGSAYMCSDQSPWAINSTLAYGFAAVTAASPNCCQCYKLTFTSTSISGKTMIVQATNTGSDVGSTQFDLAMPGGGFGIYDGCTTEWGSANGVWGAQYGGMSADQCSGLPSALQPGCGFRFGDFFEGADNPTVNWETVTCPTELTQKSSCTKVGDTPTPGVGGSAAPSATSAPVASSSAPAGAPTTTLVGGTSSAAASGASSPSFSASASGYSSLISTFSTVTVAPTTTSSATEPEDTEDPDVCEL